MELINSASLVEAAAAHLRGAILSGDLQPGEPVRVRDLQQGLGVSHIPIREAIRQLEGEGLIVVRARHTPVVAGVNLDDLAAIYELRRMIELPTVRLARERGSRASIARVEEAFSAFEAVAGDPSRPEYWERHSDFHWALVEPGANTWTRRVLEPLWTAAERYVRLFVATYATPEATLQLHRALADAFSQEDATAVVEELNNHFDVTEQGVRAGFTKAKEAKSPE
ncbi:GntR family transcriptional regulator [Microbispora sp. NBC_01189]|uniref:GntR family transcriptional regulator n=1 Tax=Microbispora sp. NBC_01189 TaxID=2903583 RepID=UPI002E130FE0|nr:GntR family transcriptional regulator [Microbispora sp. NBC_01189]